MFTILKNSPSEKKNKLNGMTKNQSVRYILFHQVINNDQRNRTSKYDSWTLIGSYFAKHILGKFEYTQICNIKENVFNFPRCINGNYAYVTYFRRCI